MIFCIEKELFWKATFIIRENDLFFGIYSSVPFTSLCWFPCEIPPGIPPPPLTPHEVQILRIQEYFLEYFLLL